MVVSVHHIEDLVVIGSIINGIVLSGLIEIFVPSVVNWPGAWGPLSHLVVILNWRLWVLWSSHPVQDLLIIGGIIYTLWPLLSPVLIWLKGLLIDTLNTALEEVVMMVVSGFYSSQESEGYKCEFHLIKL